MNIPQIEIDEFTQSILSHPEYLDSTFIINKYKKYGLDVIATDPFSLGTEKVAKYAL